MKNRKNTRFLRKNVNKQNDSLAKQKVSNNKENTEAAVKKREETQSITIRFPVHLYKKLREYAFRNNEKMNQIVVKLIEGYLKNN